MEKLKCLGCEGTPAFSFFLSLIALAGRVEPLKSRQFGACVNCATPGSLTYDQFRQRLGTLLFMQKNVLLGPEAEKPDAKTVAAGGDE